MHWFVYYYSINAKRIEVFDLFNHSGFSKAVHSLMNQDFSKEEFASKVKAELMYYFWSKCEYEITLTSNFPYIRTEELERLWQSRSKECTEQHHCVSEAVNVCLDTEKKIDIYDQVILNWDVFIDYIFQNKNVK